MKKPATPRSYTAKALGRFSKSRTKRIKELLLEISIAYCEADHFIETRCEDLIADIDALDTDIDGSVAKGRNAE